MALSGGLTTATAFWSYAHSDDDGSGGQIRRLKEQVDHSFKRHSGETLKSFFDRDGSHRLEWGDEWRSKISTTISGTTFFIAVISPSYLKSASCRDEFTQFWEKAKDSDLTELLLPILWVPVYPETKEEQRIWDIAKEHQYVDWTQIRKLDENSPEYKGLIDEMGERLGDAARKVSSKPEVLPPENESGTDGDNGGGVGSGSQPKPVEPIGPPGLVDLYAEAMSQTDSFIAHLQAAMTALSRMQREVTVDPIHPQASPGQRLSYFKRVARDIGPFADEFESEAKQAEEQARLLNKTMFKVIDLLSADAELRKRTDLEENLDRLGELPNELAKKFGDYDKARTQVSAMGRMSRDLHVPMSAFERGFDSLDAIRQLIGDWAAALEGLAGNPPDA
jgi:hypothetical protein